ncbi:MAG: cell division protein FtsA [Victivallaceae bacterium]|jgi:cell division protein FtsA|nr:cell division protein FtsA [Victivallaceae bacterium]MDD3702707.1 cell division protein FtsA [Victivallaceae bacterium]MDD4318127.1 cell division protein FtsA [Victivallaceae bacterium]MDD5662691.1 cell division protein FtsA [Victivallaceae bacterium]NLK83596.1 cell division protein FtsA [Lentisphaerota bacterium]
MFAKRKTIVTAIELGTSKICVLIGECQDDEDNVIVIGRGEVDSNGAVVKGEIIDMDKAVELLSDAVDQADELSGKRLSESKFIGVGVTSSGITSFQNVGSAIVRSPDGIISEDDIAEAGKNSKLVHLPYDRVKIETFSSYFLLAGQRRVSDPIGQISRKLDAYVNVIHGDFDRISLFTKLVTDCGVGDEELVFPVFTGIAAAQSILTDEEKNNGVIFIDMGAGTSEYLVVHNGGVMSSGVIPVGFEHVANDLSLILNLHIDNCRKLIVDGTITALSAQGRGFIEQKNFNSRNVKIPLLSFEKIIEERLREIFEIIKSRVAKEISLRDLASGGVLTGGGAMFPRTADIFRSVFECPVRVGKPFDASGAITDLESPRCSAVWGILKYGNIYLKSGRIESGGIIDAASSLLDNAAGNIMHGIRNVWNSLKV